MATLTRFVVDLVTEEPLSKRRKATIARDLTENLHVLIVEKDDEANQQVDKFAEGHDHDTVNNRHCERCLELCQDRKNGETVVAELENA